MSSSEPSSFAVVRAAYEAGARGDGDAFLALFAEEAVVRQWTGLPWVPESGVCPIGVFAQRAGAYIRSQQTIDELFIDGDDVVAIGRSRGEAVRTGRTFDVRIVHRWRVRRDRIQLWDLTVETEPLLAALEESPT